MNNNTVEYIAVRCSDSITKSRYNRHGALPNFPCTLDTTPMAPPPPEIMWAAMDCDNATGP